MPMSREQFLLLKLAEESCEIGQACSKAMQFGLDESFQGYTNRERLHKEVSDLFTVVNMLNSVCGLGLEFTFENFIEKSFEIDAYYKFSANLGRVEQLK